MGNEMKERRKRNSNIELLRVIAMLMVVVYHIICHCVNVQLHGGDETIKIANNLFNQPVFYKELYLVSGIMKWGPIGNAVFILISGYFMVEKGKNVDIVSIAKKLLTQLGFAAITLVIVSNVVLNYWKDSFISASAFNFNSMSWYVGYYFVVIACAMLFLNEYLLKLSQKNYMIFLVILFAAIEFSWTNSIFEGIGKGLGTALLGIFLYSFGGYIKAYDPFRNVRVFVFGIIIVCVNVIEYIASYNITQTAIENFDFNNPDAFFSQTILSFGNRDFVIIAIAVCLFEIFKRIRIPYCKMINFLGKGTFMVYLIHDDAFFYSLWGRKDWVWELYNTPSRFLIDLVKYGGATFFAGIMVYIAYLLFSKLLEASRWVYIKNN